MSNYKSTDLKLNIERIGEARLELLNFNYIDTKLQNKHLSSNERFFYRGRGGNRDIDTIPLIGRSLSRQAHGRIFN